MDNLLPDEQAFATYLRYGHVLTVEECELLLARLSALRYRPIG